MNLRPIKVGYETAEPKTKTLVKESLPCDFVLLSVWTVEGDQSDAYKPTLNDSTGNAPNAAGGSIGREDFCFWGFEGVCGIQHFATMPHFLIPTGGDAKNLFIRSAKGRTTQVFFICYQSIQGEIKQNESF